MVEVDYFHPEVGLTLWVVPILLIAVYIIVRSMQ
jgi:hypothetical protein